MQSFFFTVATLAAFLSTSLAQIDPNNVPIATRRQWCSSQITQCPLICTQITPGNSAGTRANSCSADNLNYACVCSNGQSPNASEFSQTIPYFICTETNTQCVKNCGMNNNACAAACTQNHPCGATDPTRVNVTSTASTTASSTGGAVATASDGVVYNGFAGGSSSSTPAGGNGRSAASSILIGGEAYGLGLLAVSVFAGFAVLL